MGVYAEEAAAEQQATESVSEVENAIEEAEEQAESELTNESAQTATDTASQVKAYMEYYLSYMSPLTDEQLQSMIDSGDTTSAQLASDWMSVKSDLGNFVSIDTPEVTLGATSLSAVAKAEYDGVNDKTTVMVTFDMNQDGTFTMSWDIDYPLSTLMVQAAMNTVMGVGIVFLALLFLSWLIGKLHIIPDMIEERTKKNAPAPKAAPAPVPAAAPAAVEEEELVDDCELVAVIAAAIAAAENTSTDGFVVRSIKKVNKRNWQRA
jgi:sodium pump decarboxylase gamma subunit